MNNEILMEILNEVKEYNNNVVNLDKKIDEKISRLEETMNVLRDIVYKAEKNGDKIDEKVENLHNEIIQEYNIFIEYICSIEQKNNEEHQNLINEINESNNNLYRYKNSVTQGIDVLKKIVG